MQTPRSKITRRDRAVEDDGWIEAILTRAPAGTLATAVDGQPFQATLMFAYDSGRRAIYLHKARHGRVWENLQMNSRACFTVAEMGRLLPGSTAMSFSVEYSSVVVFATAVLVEEPAEAEHALQMLLDKYFPHLRPEQDYRPITPEERNATAVYRLEIEEWSGKTKAAPDDFPGAFSYENI